MGSFGVNTVCPLPGSWINHVFECKLCFDKFVTFLVKGSGPGFSLCCRPSALTAAGMEGFGKLFGRFERLWEALM